MKTDPIADLLTRLRNASSARHEATTAPSSSLKKEVLRVMKERNCILDFMETPGEGPQPQLKIRLVPGTTLYVTRISKPGQRHYLKADELKPVLRGYGFAIISTSKGVMTGDQAKKKGLGGEVLCEVSL